MQVFLHDVEMAAGGAGRASTGSREVQLRMHGYRLITKGQDLVFLLEILWGTGIFPSGVKLRLDGEDRPRVWLGKQQRPCGAGGGQAAGRCSRCVSAGEYVCCFEARGFRWELHQMVRVPLQVTDVAGLPDQLSISCATSPGFQLSCCIPSAHLGYTASRGPRDGNEGMERGCLAGLRGEGAASCPQAAGSPAPWKQRLQSNLGVQGPSPNLFLPQFCSYNNKHTCVDSFCIMLPFTRSP